MDDSYDHGNKFKPKQYKPLTIFPVLQTEVNHVMIIGMNRSEGDVCFFRQMKAAVEAFDEGEARELDPDEVALDTQDLDQTPERLCEVGACALTSELVEAYAYALGRAEPRQAIDNAVDPSCLILDAPHGAEAGLAYILGELSQPPDSPSMT